MSKWLSSSIATVELGRVPQFGGTIYYVSNTDGDDSNSGLGPKDDALATIGAAIGKLSTGDAINIMADTYTETGLDLNVNNCEMWFEIGAVLDPVSGTAFTVSGDNCKINNLEGSCKITPVADAVGVSVTGEHCVARNVRVKGAASDNGWNLTGGGAQLYECRATGIKAGSKAFNINSNGNKLYDCGTVGSTTSYGYYLTGSISNGLLVECTSVGHETSGFYITTGVSNYTLLNCSSGTDDGRWKDIDHANTWSNFSFKDFIDKKIDITQGGAGTWEYNLFKVTGTVIIKSITGIVETVLTGSNTVCYLQAYSTNGSEVITKATGVAIGAAVVGSVLGRFDDDGEALAFHDATQAGMVDSIEFENQAFRLIEDRTGDAHVATYIRFIHTTDGASSGEIDWYVNWEPVSDDGFLEVA